MDERERIARDAEVEAHRIKREQEEQPDESEKDEPDVEAHRISTNK